jgi:Ca2+-binding RTX toxin-like protein
MAINLTTAELDILAAKQLQAQSGQIGYWEIYTWLADTLETKGVTSTDQMVLWLRGATEANAERGAMSELIRAYTDAQYQLRYGTPIPAGKMQVASNAVAENLIKDLLGLSDDGWPRGQIPDITRIAFADANAVGRTLFGSALGHDETDTAFVNNSAWSGTLLFSLLRSDQTGRLISTGVSGSIDTLNDWRDVFYAYKAYAAGFVEARSTYLFESQEQAVRDTVVLGTTLLGYINGPGTAQSLKDAILAGTDNPTLKTAFQLIGDVGANKFLDMLMGATVGKSVLGSTTDANFASKANTFFSAYGSTLHSIRAELLPTSASAMTGKASADNTDGASVRAALAALSVVYVQVSTVVAEQFSLYNPVTGQGNITQNWIADRATFAANYYTQQQRGGGIVPGSTNTRYFDAASNIEVLIGAGAGNDQRVQYLFGGDSADVLEGKGFADHLYGGAGDDTLDGKGGNDYLEGNTGDDILDGGAGNDKLYGGDGTDTYQFDASNWGHDTVFDSDGKGVIKLGSTTLGTASKWGNSGNVWLDASETYLITKVKISESRTDLVIARKDKPTEATITAQNWSSEKNLGIILDDSASTTPPALTDFPNPANNPNPPSRVMDILQAYVQVQPGAGSLTVHKADGSTTVSSGGDWQAERTELDTNIFESSAGQSLFIQTSQDDQQIYLSNGNHLVMTGLAHENGRPYHGFGGVHGGDDVIVTGSGSDVIFTSAGNDFVDAGDGDDFIVAGGYGYFDDVSYNGQVLNGQALLGIDGMSFHKGTGDWGTYNAREDEHGVQLWTYGLSFDQSFANWDNDLRAAGSPERGGDIVYAGGGNDHVEGGIGDDLIFLGQGNDYAVGYIGDDEIYGGEGNDLIIGDGFYVSNSQWNYEYNDLNAVGNHIRLTDSGDDVLYGGSGNDVLLGQGGDDILEGGDGDDILYGDDADYLSSYNQGSYRLEMGAVGSYAGKDYLDGGAGNDRLIGGGNDDNLFGGAGDDILWGDNNLPNILALADHGKDYLDGGDGNDKLYGGGNDDILLGGNGDDELYGETGNDMLEGGAGADKLEGGEGDDTYILNLGDGSVGNGDVITDIQGSNTLRIEGITLDDIGLKLGSTGQLMLGYGDVTKTVNGSTTTVTASNWVTIQDGLTNQAIKYLQVNEQVINFADFVGKNLNAHVDATTMTTGQQLTGGAVADNLNVQHNGTVVSAGAGNDLITLGGSDNTVQIRRGDGMDTIYGADSLRLGGSNVLAFGAGIARSDIAATRGAGGAVILSAESARHDNDAGATITGSMGLVTFADTGETVTLAALVQASITARQTADDDVIDGSVFDDTIQGLGGNDILIGYEGDDTLIADGGDDTLIADGGDDILIGGEGNDTYVVGVNAGQVTLLIGLQEGQDLSTLGTDRIVLAGSKAQSLWSASRAQNSLVLSAQQAGSTTSSSVRLEGYFDSGVAAEVWAVAMIEFADGGVFTVQELLAQASFATESDDIIYGRQGSEVIDALAGNDTVYAMGGDDVVSGGAGDDQIDGGDGNDLLYGGAGQDVLNGGRGADILHGNDGDDVLKGGVNLDGREFNPLIPVSGWNIDDRDELWGDAGNDTLLGESGDDKLYGGEGADLLDGGTGNDYLDGGEGNDRLLGGDGDDQLFGGNGDDTLKGGAGADLLNGGDGNDVYVFDVNTTNASRGGELDVINDLQGNDVIRLDGVTGVEASALRAAVKVFSGANNELTVMWGTGAVQVNGGTDALLRVVLEIDGVRTALGEYLVTPAADIPAATQAQANVNFLAQAEFKTRLQIEYAGAIGALSWRYTPTESLGAQLQQVSTDAEQTDVSQSSYFEVQTPYYYTYNAYKNSQGEYFDSPTYTTTSINWNLTLIAVLKLKPSDLERDLTNDDNHSYVIIGDFLYTSYANYVYTTSTYYIPGLTAVTEQRLAYDHSVTFDPAAASVEATLGASANDFTFSAGLVHAGDGDDVITANLASFQRDGYFFDRSTYANYYSVLGALSVALTNRNQVLLTGQTAATWIDGGAGNDTIIGSEVSDVIYGGSGFNSLDGRAGPDRYLVLDQGIETPGFDYIADTGVSSPRQNWMYEVYGGIPEEILPPGADIDTVEFGPGIYLNELQFSIKSRETDTESFNPTVGSHGNYVPYLVVERAGHRLVAIELTVNDLPGADIQYQPPGYGIEFLEFQDGQKISMATALSMVPGNHVPVASQAIAQQEAQEDVAWSFTVSQDAFSDIDGDPLIYSAVLGNGDALPGWLSFDAGTRTFSGTPAEGDIGSLALTLIATDPSNAFAEARFELTVLEGAGVNIAGSGTVQGTRHNDVLTSNAYGTHLIGGAGDDTLTVPHNTGTNWDNIYEGGTGDDTLIGSYARDTYIFNLGDGHDTITDDVRFYPNATAPNYFIQHPDDPEYQDKILFGTGVASDQLWFRQQGDDLEVSVIGTTDQITVKDWYASVYNEIEVFEVGDGQRLISSDVNTLVQAMASFSPPAAGETTLPTSYASSLAPVIAANWH